MKIDLTWLKSELKQQVTAHRYIHSLGVAETGKQLAKGYGADPEKVELAGILHDFCKFWSKEELANEIRKHEVLTNDLLDYNAELWHGPVASVIVQERFQIDDEDVIMAIRYHTSGREQMSTIEKIVCLADYIEPSRQFPGVEEIRKWAEKDLDKALLAAIDGTIQFLIKKKMKIYPLTVRARNDLIDQIEKKRKKEDENGIIG
ncbi:bis(5'-nucleosyl)-tetraphosphatase (symmetrical) YqeK [Tepidibacillus infernus]|uniref:bis(5'-nucleosyl)-tetraphosphatase (symmetrical) YqeK n=1 Tax=Tepidibacillus TaxID=1494427 RepID=UPI0008535866|nr:bis(5'-nucleosyl)-tetraphosphatase (symmetrical) YqeK [Tepidibacillus sp. HK-1]GBF10102.1 putative nicotinate-nucleotide adenylyltransferase [Tepidibacillus sp. HK-1]